MKLRLFIAAMTISSLSMASEPGPNSGFRTLKFGDPPSPEMKPLVDEGGMKGYTIISDNDKVAGYDKALIDYLFHNNRFCQVSVKWTRFFTETEVLEIKARLVQEWGEPDEEMKSDKRIVGATWYSPDKSVQAFLGALDNVKTSQPDYFAHLYIKDVRCVERLWRDNGL